MMRFFIVDDDPAVRFMLAQIIEDEDLGEVAGEVEDGALVDGGVLALKKVDVVLIDLLMPRRDGIETVKSLSGSFDGLFVMISQVESKDLIGEAYAAGIEYYITKPVNRLEVIGVIRKVEQHLLLHQSIRDIRRSLSVIGMDPQQEKRSQGFGDRSLLSAANDVLSELGMLGESGSRDLLDMVQYLERWEKARGSDYAFPSLGEVFEEVALARLGASVSPADLRKEVKAAEQRVRRAVAEAQSHLASLGLIDYSHPKFEQYAASLFDLSEIRKKMKEMEEGDSSAAGSSVRTNTKKFVQGLYLESKRLISRM
ncbi:response regulator [Paenibacillus caseinilyticus]|uniref:Transcriptional regulator n=1 Tax=Paenibacillus mucilaginosus K02 TaxID=997761 RepID=I0BBX3_9BACL|nr:response regulator [Paenibacillus mucilaginosus]AFH59870.1 transcriptional regulator [Paenibacillus mucilaginosus K02]